MTSLITGIIPDHDMVGYIAPVIAISFTASFPLIVIYELITFRRFKSPDILENKSYRNILLWRKICGLSIGVAIAAIFIGYFSSLSILLPIGAIAIIILPIVWIVLMARSKAFDMEVLYISVKNLLKSALVVILISILTYGIVISCKFISEANMFKDKDYGKVTSYLKHKDSNEEIEKALTKTYWKKNTPLHMSMFSFMLNDTGNLILATAFEDKGDLFEKILSAKNADGRTPRDMLFYEEVKKEFDNKIACMRIAKQIKDKKISDKEIINKIEKEKVYINTYFPETNKTLLGYAIEFRRFDLSKYLLSKGANPNTQYTYFSRSGSMSKELTFNSFNRLCNIPTADNLYLNKENVKKEDIYRMAKLFLEHGADPNLPLLNGTTPFMYACRRRDNPKLVKMLLENGADIHAQDIDGETPLDYFGRSYEYSEANLEVSNAYPSYMKPPPIPANFNSFDEDQKVVLEILIKAGADPRRKNPKTGKSFYDNIEKFAKDNQVAKEILLYLDKGKW